MKYAVLTARILLGAAFIVFGLEYFLHFMNLPMPELTENAKKFGEAMHATKYMTVVKALEVTGGVLVLTGLFLPLGLVILTPVIVNIVLWDMLLMGAPGLGLVFLALAIFLIFAYRANFYSLFAIGAKPSCCRM